MSSSNRNDFPYKEGTTLEIHRHRPRKPFGIVNWIRYDLDLEREWNAYCRDPEYWHDHRVDFALRYPPITGHKLKNPGTRIFKITRVVQTEEDTDGPMLIEGYIDSPDGTKKELWARVYDGVFYSLDLHLGDPALDVDYPDFMTKADIHYSTEFWAYEQIHHAELPGSVTLDFYGGWTFSLETGNPKYPRRNVRMILLEKSANARTMEEVIKEATTSEKCPPEDFSEYDQFEDRLPSVEHRLKALKSMLEAYNLIWWYAEVDLTPIGPENVLIRNDNSVALIDFSTAIVYRYAKIDNPADEHLKRKLNSPERCPHPVLRHWPFGAWVGPNHYLLVNGHFPDYRNEDVEVKSEWWQWVPEEWLEDPEAAAAWLLEAFMFRSVDLTRFSPLPDEFLNDPSHEQRSPKVLDLLEQLGRKTRDVLTP
ncbi:hypothetical protein B0T21DRAFT_451044 [Apiosordaria backusii]|uniref:Uncharacterized protein n=1 Tax=Apiosordaria backusii TaxID=314023 RepID=A0AA40BL52_9PEZI|nr:hypothetical protein B0T21DRAFT_451044 [Apiosordaria backusii]